MTGTVALLDSPAGRKIFIFRQSSEYCSDRLGDGFGIASELVKGLERVIYFCVLLAASILDRSCWHRMSGHQGRFSESAGGIAVSQGVAPRTEFLSLDEQLFKLPRAVKMIILS